MPSARQFVSRLCQRPLLVRTVRAFQGCRHLEIDCWDGKRTDGFNPMVKHGNTLTTVVSFDDVAKAVAELAFSTTEWPVLLSLEVIVPLKRCKCGERPHSPCELAAVPDALQSQAAK